MRQVALLQVGDPQGHAGVGVSGSELEATVQQLYALIELAGGEELVGAGEGVGVGHGEISPRNGRCDHYYNRIPAWICDSDFSVSIRPRFFRYG
ncbi:MAG: hypothetical protein PHQ34_07790 [Methanothrix sp.]|nr:hypothetical protein [Methanothrix sp.]